MRRSPTEEAQRGREAALHSLYALAPRGMLLGLERLERALGDLGAPHRAFPVVHVAGTNGKGSVSAMIEAILRAAGYRTGLYTSPHLHRFVERIRVDGEPLSDEIFVRLSRQVVPRDGTPPNLTFFESATALAFLAFRDAAVDVAVIEVGLGGRLDATNVVEPEVAVVTQIGLDHQDRLGDTIAAIAGEKAGIFKAGADVVIGARDPVARAVLVERAREVGAAAVVLGEDFDTSTAVDGRLLVRLETGWRGPYSVGLAGAHQYENAAIALAAIDRLGLRGFPVARAAVAAGLAQVRWPARLEHVAGAPNIVLDAAHNLDGARALRAYVDRFSPAGSRRVLLFGAMADKDYAGMLAILRDAFDATVYVAPDVPRAERPERLAAASPGETAADPLAGLARACLRAGEHGLVVVAGSIFLVAPIRAHLLGIEADPPVTL